MKKSFFRLLNVINKKILPKLSNKDPNQLSKIEKGILAYRYFVLVNSLDWFCIPLDEAAYADENWKVIVFMISSK